jgi:hypothetical protein
MGPMATTTFALADIERAVHAGWSAETTYATEAYLARAPQVPSRGQCGASALLVHDLLGGELMVADLAVDGVVDGVHYWNVLDGVTVDLTGDQFLPDETLLSPSVIARPTLPYPPAARQAYLLLRSRALATLGCPGLAHRHVAED